MRRFAVPPVPTQVGDTSRERHLLSIREIANACQLSEKAVRRAIEAGELPAVKLRSRLRVTPQDFESWIAPSRRHLPHSTVDLRPKLMRRAPAGTFRALIQDETEPGATP